MSFIIIEGENKTGKSTLAINLQKRLGGIIVKCSQPDKEPFDEYLEKIEKAEDLVIFDRFLYGELVYGPIYRGKAKLTDEQFKILEQKLKEKKAIIIYCYDLESKIKERFIEDKEEFATIENITRVLSLYEKVLQKTTIPILKFRIGVTFEINLISEIKKYI